MPGRWGFYIALRWTALSLLVATAARAVGLRRRRRRAGAGLGLQRAADPAEAERLVGQRGRGRLLRGPAVVHRRRGDGGGASRTGASSLALALYSVGAHGIMTLNDFKSVEGDRRMGIGSLPVLLGVERAARGRLRGDGGAAGRRGRLLVAWGRPIHAVAVGCCCSACSSLLMVRLLENPRDVRPGTTPPAPASTSSACWSAAFALRGTPGRLP